jgi:hypothetical protein
MTLRESLGGDVQRIYEQVDALLDSEDGVLVLFDGSRTLSYTQGFGVSPCHLELLSVELERAVRNVVGQEPATDRRGRRAREKSKEEDDRRGGAVLRQRLAHHAHRDHGSVVDGTGQSVRPGDVADSDRRRIAGRVLRMASKIA